MANSNNALRRQLNALHDVNFALPNARSASRPASAARSTARRATRSATRSPARSAARSAARSPPAARNNSTRRLLNDVARVTNARPKPGARRARNDGNARPSLLARTNSTARLLNKVANVTNARPKPGARHAKTTNNLFTWPRRNNNNGNDNGGASGLTTVYNSPTVRVNARSSSTAHRNGANGIRVPTPPPVAQTNNAAARNNRNRPATTLCGVQGGIVTSPNFLPKLPLGSEEFKQQFARRMMSVVEPHLSKLANIRRSRGSACDHKDFEGKCAPHQLAVFALARLMAQSRPDEIGNHRGLLVWHGTGQGKTLICAGIMVAFARSKHHVILTTPKGNLDNNTPEEYAKLMITYFPEFLVEQGFAEVARARNMGPPQRKELADRVASVLFSLNRPIASTSGRQLFSIYTMDRFQNNVAGTSSGGVYGVHQKRYKAVTQMLQPGGRFENGTVVIVDEAQNLFHKRHERLAAKMLSRTVVNAGYDNQAPQTPGPFGINRPVKVMALTATPGDSVEEWLSMLSLVRKANQPPFTAANSTSAFSGLFSHVFYTDPVHFAKVEGPFNLRVKLPAIYYAALLMKKKTVNNVVRGRPEQYMRAIKQAGNFLTKSDCGSLWKGFKDLLGPPLDSLNANAAIRDKSMALVKVNDHYRVVGPKMLQVVSNLAKFRGKQYVYTQTKSSAKLLARLLELMGWEKIRVTSKRAEPTRGVRGWVETWKSNRRRNGAEGKRFIVYDKEGEGPAVFNNIRELFNDKDNIAGGMCKVLIAFGKSYEGVDTNALRCVHLVEPLFSAQADMQAVGRGARYCGHKLLDYQNRTVKVLRYFAVPPPRFDMANFESVWGNRGARRPGLYQKKMNRLLDNHANLQRNAALFRSLNERRAVAVDDSSSKGFDNIAHARAVANSGRRRVVQFEERLKPLAVDARLWELAQRYR